MSGFWFQFGQSTLENWQSEFLQLFSFVVLAAVLIHHGSAESKDGTDRIERRVNEIHSMLRDQRQGSERSAAGAAPPVPMSDVVKELQAIASIAERSDDLEVVTACRRAESLLAHLRNQFLDDLPGDEAPSGRTA